MIRGFVIVAAALLLTSCSTSDQTFHLVRSRVAAENTENDANTAEELAARIKSQREEAQLLVTEARRRSERY